MVRCPRCNAHSIIRTSWTPTNPGRRFYCCSRTCGFIDWYDPEMCPRAVQIIPGLLNSMNELRATANQQAKQARRLKFILGVTWFVFVVYFMIGN
ncbi:zinc finger, GRF-type [Artemisia annua]|uniref:Zinc finger, GRF-type n=1 Tax=Artemisia annua TaxID=35608 RepID=A0A2U1QGZ5_ARTAN|nr:zinc finger, GRF-type [Artemisia annua]